MLLFSPVVADGLFLLPICCPFSMFSLQHVMSEPFEPSPFMPDPTTSFDDDKNVIRNKQLRGQAQAEADAPGALTALDKEIAPKENNVAKIRVVVSLTCRTC